MESYAQTSKVNDTGVGHRNRSAQVRTLDPGFSRRLRRHTASHAPHVPDDEVLDSGCHLRAVRGLGRLVPSVAQNGARYVRSADLYYSFTRAPPRRLSSTSLTVFDRADTSRRGAVSAGAAVAAVAPLVAASQPVKADDGPYKLPPLPYAYEALEPHIDTATMKFHHDKHHQTYVTNVNKALAGKDAPSILDLQKGVELGSQGPLPKPCRHPYASLHSKPKKTKTKKNETGAIAAGAGVRNSGGGHYNHALFWTTLCPAADSGAPSAALQEAIDKAFGSMDGFKEQFAAKALGQFGSGWAWLGVTPSGELAVTSTPNQDNPLMDGGAPVAMIPFLGLDMWEHAFYLKHQNRKPEYIAAFWNVVNWPKVGFGAAARHWNSMRRTVSQWTCLGLSSARPR
eukprot:scaffold11_cov257-Pinguiococcus_pyrenoidosus.AAC.22